MTISPSESPSISASISASASSSESASASPSIPPGISTDYIHIFSETQIEPVYASDNFSSMLIGDELEVQGRIYCPSIQAAGSDGQIQYNNGGIFGGSHFYFDDTNDSGYFQPTVDSTTAFQILDADGGTPIFNVDSTNERVGIGTNSPDSLLEIVTTDVSDNYTLAHFNGNDMYGNNDIHIGAIGSDAAIWFCSNASLRFRTNGNRSLEFSAEVDNNSDIIFRAWDNIQFQKYGGTNLVYWEINETPALYQFRNGNLILRNTTHEDVDNGRESWLSWWGEQSGGETTTLARIEASHDGAADDQKGQIKFYTNDGSDDDSPTLRMTIDSTGATDVVGDFTAGTIQADNGVSGTLVMDDGTTEKITLVFTGGILTSRTVEATTGSALADWTD